MHKTRFYANAVGKKHRLPTNPFFAHPEPMRYHLPQFSRAGSSRSVFHASVMASIGVAFSEGNHEQPAFPRSPGPDHRLPQHLLPDAVDERLG